MESGLCLYVAMKKNGLLPDMTPSQARQYYGSNLEKYLKHIYNTENIPNEEIMTNPNSMGSISILQMYLNEHPEYEFKIVYDGGKNSFWLKGDGPCIKRCGFIHMGSYDSGHFETFDIENNIRTIKEVSPNIPINLMGYEGFRLVDTRNISHSQPRISSWKSGIA